MDVRIKESLFIWDAKAKRQYVIKEGTSAVEMENVLYFYDVTKNIAVGFDKQLCKQEPQMFLISHNVDDSEFSIKDIRKALVELELPGDLVKAIENTLRTI